MKRLTILFALLLVLPLCVQSQENAASDKATSDNATSQPAKERKLPIQAGRTSVFSLAESPKPKINVDEASACPEGAGKPCALIDRTCPLCYSHPFREYDPLAKPFIHLPSPTYYTVGFAAATGVNFLGWKMSRSKRWHRMWFIPQTLSIGGNCWGISTFH